jgi:hypothetical protein
MEKRINDASTIPIRGKFNCSPICIRFGIGRVIPTPLSKINPNKNKSEKIEFLLKKSCINSST